MEFESTLKREVKQIDNRMKDAKAKGYKEPPEIKEVFDLVKDSMAFLIARVKTIEVARCIQPSITNEDLKIASDIQLATASQLMLNLIKEGLISINK